MKPGRNPFILLAFIALAIGFYFLSPRREGEREEAWSRVVEVIDGDTVIIDDGKNTLVRYLGIDAPEIALQDSPGDPLSEEAMRFNGKLVEGKRVRLEFDEQKYDVYGRLLAYVYADGVFVNGEMLRYGLATPLVIEPNGRYSDLIYGAVEEARGLGKGMWGKLGGMRPPPGNREFVIDIEKARRYEGKRVVAEGRVTDTRKTDKAVVLNIEGKMDVVIFTDDWGNFEFFGIEPEEYYKGKQIEVTGRVKMYRGTPGIIVNHPMLIRGLW